MDPTDPPPPPQIVTTARGYTRTLHAQRVTLRCEWHGGDEVTRWAYPGPPSRYCSDECRQAAQNALAAAAARRKRAAARAAHPYAARPVGRPRRR